MELEVRKSKPFITNIVSYRIDLKSTVIFNGSLEIKMLRIPTIYSEIFDQTVASQ